MPRATPGGRWRVCVTRDEGPDGPLAAALRACEFEPVSCPVLIELPPGDRRPLDEAGRHLDRYDWVVCASARSVRALTRARGGSWPHGLRTAAVGPATARALVEAGVEPPPVTADADGADALWGVLEHTARWEHLHVLVPTTPGGRRLLADRLREAGATLDEVDAYRMEPATKASIARGWAAAAPHAAVIGSPRAADTLVDAVGSHALVTLYQVVAIGPTTSAALERLGVPCVVPPRADAAEVARTLAACRAAADES